MIKFLYTRLCFYLFGNVTGDLQNYNATESVIARRAGQTRGRRDSPVSLVKKYALLINNPCWMVEMINKNTNAK